jgi:hypothetical protein
MRRCSTPTVLEGEPLVNHVSELSPLLGLAKAVEDFLKATVCTIAPDVGVHNVLKYAGTALGAAPRDIADQIVSYT